MLSLILLWLLPVVDIFKLENILSYYSSLGVDVPNSHARYGLIERWIGYLPAGFILCWAINLKAVVAVIIATLALIGPIELYLMYRGVGPWEFFRGRSLKVVAKIFLLEAYNSIGYLLLGALVQLLAFGKLAIN
ncbi:hypothetical protein AKJ45_01200 [candidate division MSBL1 archaeon SCGC-AAA261F19]|uniref:Uncharacterized protein n=1 Tax=candidate division MSBL1 archaeon SCGC-AAA261F19 TaxID=1698275 RepID=A0A133VAU7_9EURY|nr:hypothetical protein AKJ45_01200 [candidate division MSBL1 archaeon SCGC-AAA261F19]